MLNYVWGGILIIGFCYGIGFGKGESIVNALILGSKEAVTLAISIVGTIAFWCGIMKIAENSGIIEMISKKIDPVINFLFPELPKKHKARKYIATNFAANFLGLGWAATPAGIQAMEEMQKLNSNKEVATNSMCMFMIVNMSSVQIITISVIALRMEYGSVNPSEIIVPGILATIVSTILGVFYGKVYERRSKKWK